MALNPKKIRDDLEKGKIDQLTAVDLLIYLITNTDRIEYRYNSIKILQKIGIQNNNVFSVLENALVSDPNQEIRELAAQTLGKLFRERSLSLFKWTLDNEKSWQLLLSIISIIQELNNSNAKSILFEKINNIKNYKFKQSLSKLFGIQDIQSIDINYLAKILHNYVIFHYLEEMLKEQNYEIEKGLVTELDLSFISNITYGWKILKHLSEFISVFDNLKKLNLRNNKIGKIPDSIFSLFNLNYLDLSHNNISTLKNKFACLQALNYLNLRYNQLRDLPSSIGSLNNLRILDLKQNKLDSLPLTIGKLNSLETLNLQGNQLKILPNSLRKLTQLKILKLGLNNLKTIPKWIEKLESLKKLSLGGNKSLSKLEEWINFLPPIKELNLYNNSINSLPESFGSLESLETLLIPNNHLSTLPESFQNLTSLKKLDLSWNDILELPEWFDSLSCLEELNLRGNKLSEFPKSLKNLPSLKIINISLNKYILYPPKELEKDGVQIIF